VAMPPTNETQLQTSQRATVMFPGNESAMFTFTCSISLYLASSAVKHSASKPNQQINGKEGKAKKEEC